MLLDKLKNYRVILGSRSPRRRELLTGLGITYVQAAPFECEETWPAELPIERIAGYLSSKKSHAYPDLLEKNDLLITSDTVVALDGKILGKPSGIDDAKRMLSMLSGREHTVFTGVTLRSANAERSFTVSTSVRFRILTVEEIDGYVDRFRPLDKAGSYGIQEWIGYAGIEEIHGSFYNVMGLPTQRLYVELENFIG